MNLPTRFENSSWSLELGRTLSSAHSNHQLPNIMYHASWQYMIVPPHVIDEMIQLICYWRQGSMPRKFWIFQKPHSTNYLLKLFNFFLLAELVTVNLQEFWMFQRHPVKFYVNGCFFGDLLTLMTYRSCLKIDDIWQRTLCSRLIFRRQLQNWNAFSQKLQRLVTGLQNENDGLRTRKFGFS